MIGEGRIAETWSSRPAWEEARRPAADVGAVNGLGCTTKAFRGRDCLKGNRDRNRKKRLIYRNPLSAVFWRMNLSGWVLSSKHIFRLTRGVPVLVSHLLNYRLPRKRRVFLCVTMIGNLMPGVLALD